ESNCTDWAGLTSVIRHGGRERTATHVCGAVGLTGQLARIVMDARITDRGAVPPANLPAGITILRFPEPIEQYFRYSSALNDPANFVVTGPAEWDAVWRRIVARHGNPPGPPPVDFSREMLLVAAMGTQPTGGYAIRIDRVIDNGTFLEALVTRTSPGPRCGATAALTNPVDVVRVPVSTKPVRWAMSDVQTVCP
ncbi:MAG TPA: protease complex subunit PrcB family protein, partial [Caulobacteraceae bacterium]|nr:protease complex subunit PrcB family protein [Caulobacteraceae bacterium]